MLDENDIIGILCNNYNERGYRILEKNLTNHKGKVDLIFEKDGEKIFIEVKGETSSKIGTNNFGKYFNYSQVKVHVARAIYQIMTVIDYNLDSNSFIIALPNNAEHIRAIEQVKNSLIKAQIKVLLVDTNKIVSYC